MAKNQVAAGEFKAHCLRLIDEVASRRTEVVVTKRGKPLARLVPVDEEPAELFGCMAGTVAIHGDIVAPPGESWDADRD